MLPASPYVRYGVAILCALGFLHVVGQLASPAYSHRTSLDAAKVKLGLKPKPAGETWLDGRKVAPWEKVDARIPVVSLDDEQQQTPPQRENATFVMLARCATTYCCSGISTNTEPRPETRTSGARSTRSAKSKTASTASSTTTGPSSTMNRSTTSSRRTSRPSVPAMSSSVKCRRSTGAKTFPNGSTSRKRTSLSTRWGRNRSRTGARFPM